jgi:hypothetical protein
LTGGTPICVGEIIIDGQILDEFIEDLPAWKIQSILGESAKSAGAIRLVAVFREDRNGRGQFAGNSWLRPGHYGQSPMSSKL